MHDAFLQMPLKQNLKVKKNSSPPPADTIAVVDSSIHKAALIVPANANTGNKPLFQQHLLKPQHINAQYSERFTPDWFTLSLIAIIALFTWYKLFYHRMFLQLTNAFFSMATTNQIVRDESVLLQRASLNSSFIAYLVGGLFLYQVSVAGSWQHPLLLSGFIRFILFALTIALAYSAQMIALRFLSNIFNSERPAATYIFTIFLFNMMAGLLLLPIVILIAYAPLEYRQFLIGSGMAILVIFLLYRYVRVFIIWTSLLRAPVFYLFLYLCAFEIAPLLLIGKIALIQK